MRIIEKKQRIMGKVGFWWRSMKSQRVIVIDDVMTAGTALRESVDIITKAGGTLAGVVIAMNRQERSTNDPSLSAVQSIEQQYNVKVGSIISADLLIEYLEETGANPTKFREYGTIWIAMA